MNKQASLTEMFFLLNEGHSVEEVKAQFAGSDIEAVDSVAEAMPLLNDLLGSQGVLPVSLENDSATTVARTTLENWLNESHVRQPEVGQLWTVDDPGLMQLTLATLIDVFDEEESPVTVVAIASPEIGFATQQDLLLSHEMSPLGYPFMIESWHYGTIASERLVEFQGSLTDEQTDYLLALYLQSSTHDSLQEICSELDINYQALSRHIGEVSLVSEMVDAFRRREIETHLELWKTGMDALIRYEDSQFKASETSLEMPYSGQVAIFQPLLTFTLSPVEKPRRSLAAASADDLPTMRYFQGEQDGMILPSELYYSRHKGELSLSLPDLPDELRQRPAIVIVHLKDGSEDVTVDIKLPTKQEERITLLDKTLKRLEDIATLTLTVTG